MIKVFGESCVIGLTETGKVGNDVRLRVAALFLPGCLLKQLVLVVMVHDYG